MALLGAYHLYSEAAMYPLRTHLCVILLASGLSSALWPFGSRRFASNSLINAGSLGLDSTSRVIAFGDFNGDQSWATSLSWLIVMLIDIRLDILTLDAEQKTITVCIWNHGNSGTDPVVSGLIT